MLKTKIRILYGLGLCFISSLMSRCDINDSTDSIKEQYYQNADAYDSVSTYIINTYGDSTKYYFNDRLERTERINYWHFTICDSKAVLLTCDSLIENFIIDSQVSGINFRDEDLIEFSIPSKDDMYRYYIVYLLINPESINKSMIPLKANWYLYREPNSGP